MRNHRVVIRALIHVIGIGVAVLLILACGIPWREARAEPERASGPQAPDAPRATAPQPASVHEDLKLEDLERALGPFEMGGQRYTIVLHEKRLAGAQTNGGGSEALASLEIRDASGALLHQQKFDYSVGRSGFDNWCSASAQLVKGSMNNAILIDAGCLPSAPGSSGTWEIFGVWNGRFMRLGRPFATQGEMIDFVAGRVTKVGEATSFQPDVMQLRVWTGNFYLKVPLTLNWMQGQLVPPRCFEATGDGMREGGCDLDVEVERTPVDQELTFVRLFTEANENFAIPKHVVVKKGSKVEFLGVRARVLLSTGDVLEVGVADDPWLKVRIDGQEGWIHTQEDFSALGVPQAG